MTEVLLDGTYINSAVGLGTFTRAIHEAMPEWSVRIPLIGAEQGGTLAYYGRAASQLVRSGCGAATFYPFWATTLGVRSIVTVPDLVLIREATPWIAAAMRATVKRAARLVTISEWVSQQVEDRFSRPASVAYPHPERPWFDTPLAEPPPVTGPIRIAYWGGWHKRKEVFQFIDMLKATALWNDVVIFAAGVAPLAESNIRSLGSLDLNALIRMVDGCHIAIYPSAEEGYGLPIHESILRGRPIVARALPPYSEIVTRTDGLCTYKGEDPKEVETAVAAAVNRCGDVSRSSLVRPDYIEACSLLRGQLIDVIGFQDSEPST